MNLRRLVCGVMFFLRIPGPDCELCNNPQGCSGYNTRKRLEDLRKHEHQSKLTATIQPEASLQIASSLSPQSTAISSQQGVLQERPSQDGVTNSQ